VHESGSSTTSGAEQSGAAAASADESPDETHGSPDETREGAADMRQIKITVNGEELSATLADNSSARALADLLAEGPITVEMEDYSGFEKVGDLGTTLPRNDTQISTEPGDLILYQGSNFVIYYGNNSWSLTRLGKIDDLSAQELQRILGTGAVTVELSLAQG
jgi:hypothetical protein